MLLSSKFRWLRVSMISLLGAIALSLPAKSVDRITFTYPPLGDFSISVQDLEVFAKEGKITPDFAFYAKRMNPQQLQQFRAFLQQRFDYSPIYVSQFTYAPLAEKLLERMGEVIQTDSRDNGMKSLRSALILAAADKTEGLTALNVLRRFPGHQIHLNLNEGLATVSTLSDLLQRRDRMVASIRQIANSEAANPIGVSSKVDLIQLGTVQWKTRSFNWMDQTRQRLVPGTLYLPQVTGTAIPVIVISHGVAEDRTTFAYLAQHLASHGFAVAVVEHTGGDAHQLQQYFSGLAPAPKVTELLERPRDVSFLLDELQRQAKSDPTLGQLNLQQVGLIGHSLGGYTILALAGATIDFNQVKQDCNPNRSLDMSVLLQCRANELKPDRYSLQDPRIKAVFAINPLVSTIFGKQGMSQVRLPVFLMGGSDDIVTPVVPEQIKPFTWLQASDKYLAILEKGTHFSTQAVSQDRQVIPVPTSLIGPNPAIAQSYTKALSLAFFQTYLNNQGEFRAYLTPSYAQTITQSPMPLDLVQASASDQIAQLLQQRYSDFAKSP